MSTFGRTYSDHRSHLSKRRICFDKAGSGEASSGARISAKLPAPIAEEKRSKLVPWMRVAPFAFACLTSSCGAADAPAHPPSATAPTAVEPAPPPEEEHAPSAAPVATQPLANSQGAECPDQFRLASTGCLPVDLSEADAVSEREFYGEVEARVVEEFNSKYGGSFLRGYLVDVWTKQRSARAHSATVSPARLFRRPLSCARRHGSRASPAAISAEPVAKAGRPAASLAKSDGEPIPWLPTGSRPCRADLDAMARVHAGEHRTHGPGAASGCACTIASRYKVSGLDIPPPKRRRRIPPLPHEPIRGTARTRWLLAKPTRKSFGIKGGE